MDHQIISRQEALLAGRNKFFTGFACCNGHIAERRVDNHACVECRAKWRKAPEKRMLRAGSSETRKIELQVDNATDARTKGLKTRLRELCGREVSVSVLHRAGLDLLAKRLENTKDASEALGLVA
jgi:hypothetical protein